MNFFLLNMTPINKMKKKCATTNKNKSKKLVDVKRILTKQFLDYYNILDIQNMDSNRETRQFYRNFKL